MSCKWPDEPACKRVRISNLLTCTIMLDGNMYLDNVDIDDLATSASDLLDQYRKRGMTIQRKVLNNTYDAKNLEKLKGLLVKFEAAIQDHDAELAAAQAALVEHECMHGDHDTQETFQVSSSSAHASSSSVFNFFRCYRRHSRQRQRKLHDNNKLCPSRK
jgi:hypothetical protein